MHSVLGSVVLLVAVMAATIGRRRLRRQLIALPIGTFLHLVFDGVWGDTHTFWWPFSGHFGDDRLLSVQRGGIDVVLELVGIGILVWAYRRFRLDESERRHVFLTTGRLGRDLV